MYDDVVDSIIESYEDLISFTSKGNFIQEGFADKAKSFIQITIEKFKLFCYKMIEKYHMFLTSVYKKAAAKYSNALNSLNSTAVTNISSGFVGQHVNIPNAFADSEQVQNVLDLFKKTLTNPFNIMTIMNLVMDNETKSFEEVFKVDELKSAIDLAKKESSVKIADANEFLQLFKDSANRFGGMYDDLMKFRKDVISNSLDRFVAQFPDLGGDDEFAKAARDMNKRLVQVRITLQKYINLVMAFFHWYAKRIVATTMKIVRSSK